MATDLSGNRGILKMCLAQVLAFGMIACNMEPRGASRAEATRSPAVQDLSARLGLPGQHPAAPNPSLVPSCVSDSPLPVPGTREITIYFYCSREPGFSDPLYAVRRRIPATKAVLQATIEAWVRGPAPKEVAAGLRSGAPIEAHEAPGRTRVASGVAWVEVGYPLASVNNFTTSNVTGYFMNALERNVFQFQTIRSLDLTPLCPDLTVLSCEMIERTLAASPPQRASDQTPPPSFLDATPGGGLPGPPSPALPEDCQTSGGGTASGVS